MIYLSRNAWRADTTLARRGHPIGPVPRTEVYIHHTLVTDADVTANEWNSVATVKSRMRRLQTARPDLGLDVPYNFVAFCMSDDQLVLCEGRGLYRTGAHTRNHNRSALGVAFQGDFETAELPEYIDFQLSELAEWLRTLRNELGFVNLGDSRPGDTQVWGHRDAKSTRTICPGQKLYDKLSLLRFIDEEDDNAMDKLTWKLVQRALQQQSPPLYGGRAVDGKPGRNTNLAVRAFEKRMGLSPRGVVGTLGDPIASIWPATRELLFATVGSKLSTN